MYYFSNILKLLNIMPIYNKLKEFNTDKKTFSELKVIKIKIFKSFKSINVSPREWLSSLL